MINISIFMYIFGQTLKYLTPREMRVHLFVTEGVGPNLFGPGG